MRSEQRSTTVWRTPLLSLGVLLGVAVSAPAIAQEFYVFPKNDQSQEQQEQDEFQCVRDARNRTGFDPMAVPRATEPAPQQRGSVLGGAAGGAIVGTAVGAIAGNAGKGAAMGAAGGGLMGGMRRNSGRRDQEQWQRDQQANYAQQRQQYNRAFTACMEARDYTVR